VDTSSITTVANFTDLVPLICQSFHSIISSPNISMWIYSNFNYISGLPYLLIHSSDGSLEPKLWVGRFMLRSSYLSELMCRTIL
jgi:hypothetical protein